MGKTQRLTTFRRIMLEGVELTEMFRLTVRKHHRKKRGIKKYMIECNCGRVGASRSVDFLRKLKKTTVGRSSASRFRNRQLEDCRCKPRRESGPYSAKAAMELSRSRRYRSRCDDTVAGCQLTRPARG